MTPAPRSARFRAASPRVYGVAVIVWTVLALTACTGSGTPVGLGGDGAASFSGPSPCPDGASCAGGFTAGGIRYGLSCRAVRPDAVEDRVLARGVYDGTATEVRPLTGVDIHVLLAIRLDSRDCGEHDPVLGPWTMLLPAGAADTAVHDAICRVVFEQSYAANNCAQP